MKLFKSVEDAERTVNKIVPIILPDKEGILSVSVSLTPTGEDNEYYAGLDFVFDGDSFDRETSDRIMDSRRNLNKRIKDYLGIKLIFTNTGISVKK